MPRYSPSFAISVSTPTAGPALLCRAEQIGPPPPQLQQQQRQQRQQLLQQQQQQQQQSPPPPPTPRKKLRRERWQWSKGDGPGEYGGPPLDFKIRQFTWKDRGVDPVASRADYIWNKEWQSHLQPTPALTSSEEGGEEDKTKKKNEKVTGSASPSREQPIQAGFLSLNRSMALERIDVDLSKELVRPEKSILVSQVEALREGLQTNEAIQQDKPRWRMAPTRREQKAWSQARKRAGMAVLVSDGEEGQQFAQKRIAASKKDYSQIKGDLEIYTMLFGALGSGVAYVWYSTEIALSYGIGLLGSLVYVKMLGNSVDSIGQSNVQGVLRGAIGQPRLLVPVILVMFFNRWNTLLVPEHNVPQLWLIPMLVGFFTYKAAAVAEVFRDVLQDISEERNL